MQQALHEASLAENELREIEYVIDEIEVYEQHKRQLRAKISEIESEYQREEFGYLEFKSKLNALLKGKSVSEQFRYYNSYIYSLLKRIDSLIGKIFIIAYNDKRAPRIISKPIKPPAPGKQEKSEDVEQRIQALAKALHSKHPIVTPTGETALNVEIPELKLKEVKQEIALAEEQAGEMLDEMKQKAALARAEKSAPEKQRTEVSLKFHKNPVRQPLLAAYALLKSIRMSKRSIRLHAPSLPHIALPRLPKPRIKSARPQLKQKKTRMFSKFPSVGALFKKRMPSIHKPAEKKEKTSFLQNLAKKFEKKKKSPFIEEVLAMEHEAKKGVSEKKPLESGAGISFGWFSTRRLTDELLGRFKRKQGAVVGGETEIPVHIKRLRQMRKRLYTEERLTGFDTTLLAQEAKRVRRILEVEKTASYQGSSLGLIANVTVKKISLFLVGNFPEFFGFMYNALRAANIKVLSNTYVNIMILISLGTSAVVGFSLIFLFFALGYPLYQIFLRSILIAGVAGILSATTFYVYPFVKIKERKRSIMTNMPFAINHISSVAASGVPPAKMFELISASGEYGEVAVEIKKIVDFINIFGYDFLTSVRAVASTTPSVAFKEFLEGMVSTIETGGDLDSYLKQKSEEATLTYQLERQRYNETISTYSDLYTGILIAAPLFFIAALALVNLLGGTIAGLGVDLVMALGAYVVIPLLNIGFLIFLNINQPEV